jgi:hypothetical protein
MVYLLSSLTQFPSPPHPSADALAEPDIDNLEAWVVFSRSKNIFFYP